MNQPTLTSTNVFAIHGKRLGSERCLDSKPPWYFLILPNTGLDLVRYRTAERPRGHRNPLSTRLCSTQQPVPEAIASPQVIGIVADRKCLLSAATTALASRGFD